MADLSKFNARQLAMIDREIQEFRSWFDDATEADRAEMSTWLTEAASVEAKLPDRKNFSLLCRVNNLSLDDEGTIVYDGVVHLNPKAMRDAIARWTLGEEFLPEHWMETL